MKFQIQSAREEYKCDAHSYEKTITKGSKYVRIGRKRLCKGCGLNRIIEQLRDEDDG